MWTDLTDYYQPLYSYTDDELREHRAHITKTNPSLPARAGRLYAKLHWVYQAGIDTAERQHATGPGSRSRSWPAPAVAGKRPVQVTALARPEPDLRKLSLVLIAMAEQMAREGKR